MLARIVMDRCPVLVRVHPPASPQTLLASSPRQALHAYSTIYTRFLLSSNVVSISGR